MWYPERVVPVYLPMQPEGGDTIRDVHPYLQAIYEFLVTEIVISTPLDAEMLYMEQEEGLKILHGHCLRVFGITIVDDIYDGYVTSDEAISNVFNICESQLGEVFRVAVSELMRLMIYIRENISLGWELVLENRHGDITLQQVMAII